MRGGRVEAKSSGWNLLNKLLLPSKKGKKVAAVGTLTHNAAQARLNALNVYGPGKKTGHTRDVSNGGAARDEGRRRLCHRAPHAVRAAAAQRHLLSPRGGECARVGEENDGKDVVEEEEEEEEEGEQRYSGR